MNSSTVSTPASRLAERTAWMHQPVHLSSDVLPWFVLRMLEWALHKYLCSFEQAFLAMMELYRQGKLEPWPEAATPQRARRTYKMKSAPAAPSRDVGDVAAPSSPEAASAPAGDAAGVVVGVAHARAVRHPVVPVLAVDVWECAQQVGLLWGGGLQPHERWRRTMFFDPAEAGGNNCVQIVPVN